MATRKRPTRKTIDKTKVIDEITLDICEWIGDGDKTGLKDCVSELINNNVYYDAYDLAKELECDFGLCPDMELVQILDRVEYKVYLQHNLEVEEWVSKRKIKPKFKIGDKVKVTRNNNEYEGEVVNIDDKRAKYLICCEEAGHVKEGIGTRGFLIEFEEVEQKN